MAREFLTIVIPLALPTIVYLLWLRLSTGGVNFRIMPLVWMAAVGAVLLAIVLFTVTVHFGTSARGTYVAPRWHDGRIEPGHFEPKP